MTPDEREKVRVMGRRLAVVVRKGSVDTTSTAALQAVVADLIENQTELLPPLKDLVGRPAFQRLIPRAGSGTGSAERSALLQDLRRTFAPAVIQALAELLDSFLDLPSAPPAEGHQPKQRKPEFVQAKAGHSSEQAILDPSNVPSASKASPKRAAGWIVASAALAAFSFGSFLALRNSVFCSVFGTCTPQQAIVTEKPLAAANRAGEALKRATSLDAYQDAAESLEQELLGLSGDQIPAQQKPELKRLEQLSQQAKTVLLEETYAEDLLSQAAIAIKAANALTGTEQQQEIEKAVEALKAIPDGSFASQQVRELKDELAVLELKASPDQGFQGPLPKASVSSREQREAEPTPSVRQQPQAETAIQEPGGWRDPPLWESPPGQSLNPSRGSELDQPLF